MEGNTHKRPSQDKTLSGLIIIGLIVINHVRGNPHQPQQAKWELIKSGKGVPISVNQAMYQPTFHIDLCDILGKTFNTVPSSLPRGPGDSFSQRS